GTAHEPSVDNRYSRASFAMLTAPIGRLRSQNSNSFVGGKCRRVENILLRRHLVHTVEQEKLDPPPLFCVCRETKGLRALLAYVRELKESDTPRGAGGLVSGAASKAVVPLVEASR